MIMIKTQWFCTNVTDRWEYKSDVGKYLYFSCGHYRRLVVAQWHKVWLQTRLVVGSIPTRGREIFIYIYIFISSLRCRDKSAALSSATHHAMPPELGGKWGTEYLNTRFPLPTRAGYKLIFSSWVSFLALVARQTIALSFANPHAVSEIEIWDGNVLIPRY